MKKDTCVLKFNKYEVSSVKSLVFRKGLVKYFETN